MPLIREADQPVRPARSASSRDRDGRLGAASLRATTAADASASRGSGGGGVLARLLGSGSGSGGGCGAHANPRDRSVLEHGGQA